MGLLDTIRAAQSEVKTVEATVEAPAASKEVKVEAPAQEVVVASATSVAMTDEAHKALSAMFGAGATKSLAELADDIDEGGVRESLPFAQLKKGNWKSYSKLPPELLEFMPAGDRPYRVIFLTHRLAAIGWQGDGQGTKSAPLWAAAVKHPMTSQLSESLNKDILRIGSKVKFTKKENKVKFDTVGRLVPELHILCWRPDTGFMVLVVAGFDSVKETLDAFRNIDAKSPVTLNVKSSKVVNPKATEEERKSWEMYFVEPAVELTPQARDMNEKFAMLERNSTVELANTCVSFAQTSDYTGLSESELVAKLAEYSSIN